MRHCKKIALLFCILFGCFISVKNFASEPLGIIFDCDGTLIDSEQFHFLSWRASVEKRGVTLSREEYFLLSGKSIPFISKKLYERAEMDSPEAIANDKIAIFRQMQKKGIPPIERTVRFVRELAKKKKELGIKLAVASAGYKDEILINLKNLGIEDAFDLVVSGIDDLGHYHDPEGVNKPKPYIYLHAAKALGLEPSQCIAIEDSNTGVLSSTRAGMLTFAVPNSFTLHHDFSQATYIIPSTQEFEVSKFFEMIRSASQNLSK